MTVGFGIAPNLLTLHLEREEGARGLGLRHPYRRWGFSPRPENIGRPEWTTFPEYDQTPPREQAPLAWENGMSPCCRNRAAAPYLEVRSRRQTGGADAELDPRSFARGLIEAEVDLRAVKSEILQLPAIEMAQHRQRGVTLATRDRRRHQAIDKAARARQKQGSSAPCNWRGGGGQNVFKNSHSAIFQVAGMTCVRASAVGTASICLIRNPKTFREQ